MVYWELKLLQHVDLWPKNIFIQHSKLSISVLWYSRKRSRCLGYDHQQSREYSLSLWSISHCILVKALHPLPIFLPYKEKEWLYCQSYHWHPTALMVLECEEKNYHCLSSIDKNLKEASKMSKYSLDPVVKDKRLYVIDYRVNAIPNL